MVWFLSAWALLSLPNVSLLSLKRKTSNKINICFRNSSDSQFFMKFRPLKRNKDHYSPLENTFLLLVPERRTSSVLVWAFHCLPEDTPLGETITWRVSLQIDWPWLVPKDCSVMVGGAEEISRKTRASWLQALFLMVSCMLSVRKDYGKSITVSPKLHCVTRSPILWPWSSSQHGEARQLDSHHPIFQWVSHPSLLSCSRDRDSRRPEESGSVICFLFLSSWLLLAHLGVSVNRPKAYLCSSVFRGPFLSPCQSSPVIRTRQAGNHSTSFIVCSSGSAPEYSGDMPLFTLTLLGYVEVLLTQSYPTLCDPMDCSSPGSFVCGILQARILEWVAISFSRGSSEPRDQTQVSCIVGEFLTIWAIWGVL